MQMAPAAFAQVEDAEDDVDDGNADTAPPPRAIGSPPPDDVGDEDAEDDEEDGKADPAGVVCATAVGAQRRMTQHALESDTVACAAAYLLGTVPPVSVRYGQ